MNLIRPGVWRRARTLDAQGEKRFAALLNGLEFATARFSSLADLLGIYFYALQQQDAAAARKRLGHLDTEHGGLNLLRLNPGQLGKFFKLADRPADIKDRDAFQLRQQVGED